MYKEKCLFVAVAAAFMLLLMDYSPAYAYLDPGTGSVILQGILGTVAVVAVMLKIYWHRVLLLLGIRKDDGAQQKDGSGKTNYSDDL